jgi:hypothetical protein
MCAIEAQCQQNLQLVTSGVRKDGRVDEVLSQHNFSRRFETWKSDMYLLVTFDWNYSDGDIINTET